MNYLFERSDLLCDLLLHGEKPVKIGAAITIGNIARTGFFSLLYYQELNK